MSTARATSVDYDPENGARRDTRTLHCCARLSQPEHCERGDQRAGALVPSRGPGGCGPCARCRPRSHCGPGNARRLAWRPARAHPERHGRPLVGSSGCYFATVARFALLAASGRPRTRPCYTPRRVEAYGIDFKLAAEKTPAQCHRHRHAKLRFRDMQCFPVVADFVLRRPGPRPNTIRRGAARADRRH